MQESHGERHRALRWRRTANGSLAAPQQLFHIDQSGYLRLTKPTTARRRAIRHHAVSHPWAGRTGRRSAACRLARDVLRGADCRRRLSRAARANRISTGRAADTGVAVAGGDDELNHAKAFARIRRGSSGTRFSCQRRGPPVQPTGRRRSLQYGTWSRNTSPREDNASTTLGAADNQRRWALYLALGFREWRPIKT